MWRAGYRLLLWLAFPVVIAKLWWRGRYEPGYRHDLAGRFGWPDSARPDRPLIWVHAVSLGEMRAAEPLVRALQKRYPGHTLLLTQMTATGRDAARQLYEGEAGILLAWLPYDYPSAARRFLRHFRPSLGVILETEIWPHLLRECGRHGVPVLLANARLSERSARRYQKLAPLLHEALPRFAAIGAQTTEDAARLTALGAPAHRIELTGNLKFDVEAPAAAQELGRQLRERFGERRVLLAASLREGEEELLLSALQSAGGLPGNALTVLVPRHPQRFDDVGHLLEQRGLAFVRRSSGAPIPEDCRFVLGDSLGEMAAYYAACDCAFVGGSLLPHGGQNLIEACAAGVPVIVGPHTWNFSQVAEDAVAVGAALRVIDADSLVHEVSRLLGDGAACRRMGAAGLAFCSSHRGAVAKTIALCERLLPV